ncbi:MAG: hypothetical protein U0L73_12925 [Ruminococcus bromii]|nr:hypothetical protein [Ruminococcus bromii]
MRKNDHTGETAIAKNGMKMTIIVYRNSKDIDVQFDDGAKRENVSYVNFKKGNIRHPKEQERRANLKNTRIGETRKAKNGLTMKITEYNNYDDIIVEFQDKELTGQNHNTKVRTRYGNFKKGEVLNPNYSSRYASILKQRKERLNMSKIANNGQKMSIKEYHNANEIIVEFDDDNKTRVKTTYESFKRGQVGNPNYNNKYIGKTSIASNGMTMTIIAYRKCHDIDVQFEDGAIRKGVTYSCFTKGNVRHPKEQERRDNLSKARLGKTSIASNGMTMTIIEYNDATNIIVEFNDEYHTRVKTSYSSFKKGSVENPNHIYNPRKKDRTGETSIATNGMTMTIVKYINSKNIIVEFNDEFHTRVKTDYYAFKDGYVKNPHFPIKGYINPRKKDRTGETSVATNGMTITIVKYINNKNIGVQFEDGFIKEGIDYATFTTGSVQNPHFPVRGKGTYKTFQTQYAYNAPNGNVYFYCECQKCGFKKNLTARELINLNHVC